MTRCHSEHDTGKGLGWKPPTPIRVMINTPRLVIRAYTLADVHAVHEAVASSRDTLLPWMPWARSDHDTPEGTAKYVCAQAEIARAPADKPDHLGVGIFERGSGLFVGGTGCHDFRADTASAEAGYWIRADRRRLGYCTEAFRHWLSFCFRAQDDPEGGFGLARVRVYCSSANDPSKRIPEKLNLTPEVTQRRDYFIEGLGITDRLGWGVLAEGWDTEAHAVRVTPS